jgi:uncharacterized protein (DUF849 family)
MEEEMNQQITLRAEEKVLRKAIITAAITGQGATPVMSEFLPLTPEQIAEDAIMAAKAGAAIVHIHARKHENGEPTPNLPIFREIVTEIKKRCNVIINITTGGAGTPEERIKVVPEFKPEMATLNCGSLSGTAIQVYERMKDKIKYDWERAFLSRETFIFENTYKMMREYSQACRVNETRPEIEIWDIGQISAVKFMVDRNYINTPIHLQFVMGALSGMPATVGTLVFVYDRAREVLGNFSWSVAAVGKDQIPLGATALALGGHVRVGLEDSLYAGYGRLARNSAEQVERIISIAREMSIIPATPDEVRQMLNLKGLNKVNY